MTSVAWTISLQTFCLLITLIDSRAVDPRCQPMRIPWCAGVYDAVIFPNFLGHQTQEEAYYAMHKLWPLIQTECSPQILHYLCRLYAPQCPFFVGDHDVSYHPQQYRPPCEDACLKVRHDCHEILWKHQIPWPSELECHHLRRADCIETPEVRPTEPPAPTPVHVPEPLPPAPPAPEPEPEPEPETTTEEPTTTEEVTEPPAAVPEESSESPESSEETTTPEPTEETATITMPPSDGLVEIIESSESEETTTEEVTTEAVTEPAPESEDITTTPEPEPETEAPSQEETTTVEAAVPEPEPAAEETTTEAATEETPEPTTAAAEDDETTVAHIEPEPIAPDSSTGSLLGITPVIEEHPPTPDGHRGADADAGSGDDDETTSTEATTAAVEPEVETASVAAVDAAGESAPHEDLEESPTHDPFAEEPETHAPSIEEEETTTSTLEEETTTDIPNVLVPVANADDILEATVDPQATEQTTTHADAPADDASLTTAAEGEESPRSDRATSNKAVSCHMTNTNLGMLFIYLVTMSLIFHGGA